MVNFKPYVLRYWETEFAELRPSKNRAGNRVYKEKDIELIRRIMGLLYGEKFTIEGARQQLKHGGRDGKGNQMALAFDHTKAKLLLTEIREELTNLLTLLGQRSS